MASSRPRYSSSVMPSGLAYLNRNSQAVVSNFLNAYHFAGAYHSRVSKPRFDWHLAEWLAYYGKRQVDIVKDLDWNKARVSLMISVRQPYTRDAVNELSAYLNIKPYELLMDPAEAMMMRRLRADLIRLAETAEPEELKKVSSS